MEFPADDDPPGGNLPNNNDSYNLSEVDELLKEETLFTPFDLEPIPFLRDEEPEVTTAIIETLLDLFTTMTTGQ